MSQDHEVSDSELVKSKEDSLNTVTDHLSYSLDEVSQDYKLNDVLASN